MKKCIAVSSETPFKLCKNNAIEGSAYCIIHIFNFRHALYFFLLGALLSLNIYIWINFFKPNPIYSEYTSIKQKYSILESDKDINDLEKKELLLQIKNLKNDLELKNKEKKQLEKKLTTQKDENKLIKNEIQNKNTQIEKLNKNLTNYMEKFLEDKVKTNNSIDQLYSDAFLSFKNNNIEEAKNILRIILQKSPNHINSLNLLAAILNNFGETEEALKLLYHAYDISKNKSILDNIEMIKKFPNQQITYPEK